MLVRSEMYPIKAGKIAPPMMDITSKDEPSLVYGPRCFKLSAKMVGNMIEWKNPITTTAQTEAAPGPNKISIKQVNDPSPNSESNLAAGTRFITYEPMNLPSMNPSRCSFK